ncbi:hypothetical protein GCM10027199_73260 [Amycolatopsis magusensis]
MDLPLSALDTVAVDTPALAATSLMVAMAGPLSLVLRRLLTLLNPHNSVSVNDYPGGARPNRETDRRSGRTAGGVKRGRRAAARGGHRHGEFEGRAR